MVHVTYLDRVELTPDGFRTLSEAAEQLRNKIYQVKDIDHRGWELAISEHIRGYFLTGRIFLNFLSSDFKLLRLSPRMWRNLHDQDVDLIGMELGPFRNLAHFRAYHGMTPVLSDRDFDRFLDAARLLPRRGSGQKLADKTSPIGTIIRLSAAIIKNDPLKPKSLVRAELLGSGLHVSENAWERKLYPQARIAAGLDRKGLPGRRKHVEKSGGD